jgi:hypothetical protein
MIDFCRCPHLERFMRPFVVEVLSEAIEGSVLGCDRAPRRLRGLII